MQPIIKTVSALLYHGREVLLHKHRHLGAWMGPGGKLEQHEYLLPEVVALEREILEETGLVISFSKDPIGDFRTRYRCPDDMVLIQPVFNNDPILDYTFIQEVGADVRAQELKPEAGLEFKWFELSYAINSLPLMPDTKQQLERIRDKLWEGK